MIKDYFSMPLHPIEVTVSVLVIVLVIVALALLWT
jgi:hypothetical protein